MTAPGLLTEVEVLRRRVVEMEGKDEELVRMSQQCQELDRRLAKEAHQNRSLKTEVDQLNSRISDLDRVEETLGRSKQDCTNLKNNLERERDANKTLSDELDALRLKVKELEVAEGRLEKSEMLVRQDLGKLRTLTVALVEDRRTMAERLQQAEEKIHRKEVKRHEPGGPTTARDERQLPSKFRADLEEKIRRTVKEKDELQRRLKTEEERNRELQERITTMKKKLHVFDNRKEKEEKYMCGSIPNRTAYNGQSEDNKVRELTQEMERLQRRLQEKEVMEGELMRLEEDFELLESKLADEQRRTQALTEELELTKKELSRYEQVEKQEINQEHLLLCHLQKEQVKCRLLTREVDTLKEKLQKLVTTETSVCRVQPDRTLLQRQLAQQEARNKDLAREVQELGRELQGCRTIQNMTCDARRRFNHQSTRGVQTEPAGSVPPDYSRVRHEETPDSEETARRSPLVDGLSGLNSADNRHRFRSRSEAEAQQTVNGDVMTLTHTPGQPLHIRVTPHHTLNTATLEISSPSGDAAAAPTSAAAPKQRITIIQNPGPPPHAPSSSPDRTIPPPNGNPVSLLSPDSSSAAATEDSKVHVHMGSPHMQPVNGSVHGGILHPAGSYFLRHEQRTQVITDGSRVGKITSSITISPANAPAAHASGLYD